MNKMKCLETDFVGTPKRDSSCSNNQLNRDTKTKRFGNKENQRATVALHKIFGENGNLEKSKHAKIVISFV